MSFVIFEDSAHRGFAPLVDFRPLWRLKLGYGELADRLAAAFGDALWWPREDLRPLVTDGLYPAGATDGETIFVNAALRNPAEATERIVSERDAGGEFVESPHGPRLVWFRPSAGLDMTEFELTRDGYPEKLAPELPALGRSPRSDVLFNYPWELIAVNADELRSGYAVYTASRQRGEHVATVLGDPALVFVEENAVVEPGVILDAAEGPVVVAAGARVKAPSRLEGPCFIGAKTIVDTALIRPGTSVGRNCRLAGEIEESLLSDHVNKHHYGFLGHACLGEWVNLGAGTTNSDLKNNYGAVRVHTPAGRVDSGSLKVGCFIGDHAKTGIGTLIGTGACLGAFCNVFDQPVLSGWLPPFSWASREGVTVHRLEKALETARRAMARRGVELDDALIALITDLFHRHASSR